MAEQTEAIPTPESHHGTTESADEALDAIDFEDGDDEEESVAPATDETPDAEPEGGDGGEGEPEPAGVDRDALAKALGVLRRDNVPDDLINDWMENNPDKLLAWAEKAGKRQSDIDKRLRGEKPDEAEDTTEKAKADPTGQPADEDFEEMVRPFADELGSETATETLTKLASHVRESTLSEVRPKLEAFEQGFGKMAQMLETMLVKEARSSLRERFPGVDDESKWGAIRERAQVLSKTGGYDSIEAMLADAAKIELGEVTTRERQAELAKRHKARSNGTPTKPRQTRQSKPPATHDERIEAALDAALGEGE